MKNKKPLLVILLLIFLLPGCISPAKTFPSEGIWFCEKLNITLDFYLGTGSILLDGEEIFCVIVNQKGSKLISLLNQNREIEEFYLGETVFFGSCIGYDDKVLTISEYRTETIYTFYRIDNSNNKQ